MTPKKINGSEVGKSYSATHSTTATFRYKDNATGKFSNDPPDTENRHLVTGRLLYTTKQNLNGLDSKELQNLNGWDGTSYTVLVEVKTSTHEATSYLSRSHSSIQSLRGANYEVYLPVDYLHMLNCVCIYYVAKQKDCYDAGSYIEIPATRLTADSWSQIITDIYNRPSPMKPYYYIHNENQTNIVPTNPYKTEYTNGSPETLLGTGTDMSDIYRVTRMEGVKHLEDDYYKNYPGDSATGAKKINEDDPTQVSNFQRTFLLGNDKVVSLVEKPTAMRFGNTSNVRCEIRYGNYLRFARYSSNAIDERDNIGEG